jgi:hypothetical protein
VQATFPGKSSSVIFCKPAMRTASVIISLPLFIFLYHNILSFQVNGEMLEFVCALMLALPP